MTRSAVVTAVLVGLLLTGAATVCRADPINLLVNPGFETGDFSGWIVAGNSIQSGVARDGVVIPNAVPPFLPSLQNVRTGQFAANALLRSFPEPAERIILQQTITVPESRRVIVGFFLGNDSASPFGVRTDARHTQIFVDGTGLPWLASSTVIFPGSAPANFSLFEGAFFTGTRTTVDVAFAISGSGTARVGASFDDAFAFAETTIPEPSSMLLLTTGVVALLARGRSRRKSDQTNRRFGFSVDPHPTP